MSRRRENLTGRRQGNLTVLEDLGYDLRVKCDCGREKTISRQSFKQGTRSCGCLRPANMAKANGAWRDFITAFGTSPRVLNSRPNRNNLLGIRGVCRLPDGRYLAQIWFRGKNHNLGYYRTVEEARAARARAEEEYFDPVREAVKAAGNG